MNFIKFLGNSFLVPLVSAVVISSDMKQKKYSGVTFKVVEAPVNPLLELRSPHGVSNYLISTDVSETGSKDSIKVKFNFESIGAAQSVDSLFLYNLSAEKQGLSRIFCKHEYFRLENYLTAVYRSDTVEVILHRKDGLYYGDGDLCTPEYAIFFKEE
jgi:hypothetical protein